MTIWMERIKTAQRVKRFTARDIEDSGNWKSCAVSENPRIFVRDSIFNPGPYNPTAKRLGMEFMEAVKKNYFYKAEKLFKRIQRLRA